MQSKIYYIDFPYPLKVLSDDPSSRVNAVLIQPTRNI